MNGSKDSEEEIASRMDEAEDAELSERDRMSERKRMRKVERTNRDLKAEVQALSRLVDEKEDTVALLEGLRSPVPKPKKLKPIRHRRGDKKLPVAWVALASDWHTPELVALGQTNGLNEHNPEIGIERAWKWARGLVDMVKLSQVRLDVRTVVIWLGGDFLVNDGLHYAGIKTVGMSPPQEATMIRNLLAEVLGWIRAELDVERILLPTSWGNHDRSTPKIVPGHAGDYSYANEIYKDLASWFAADSSMEFVISTSEWNHVDVHGYPILFHHGHALRYAGGVGGLSVPLMRKIGQLRADYDFRSLCIGHFHQSGMFQAGTAFTNGSLVGYNGYAADLGLPSEPPSQVAFVIDLERLQVSDWFRLWGD